MFRALLLVPRQNWPLFTGSSVKGVLHIEQLHYQSSKRLQKSLQIKHFEILSYFFFQRLSYLCADGEVRELLQKIGSQAEVVQQSAERVSSTAEVYGAVQQEARIARAVEIMLLHVENLKRT